MIKWKICIKFGCWISLRNTWLGYLHYMQSEIHIINFVCFNCNNSKKWSWELHWWRMRSNHRKASLRRVRAELCLHKKRSSLDTIAVIIAKRLILTVVFTDELVDAIPIIINILDVCSHDANQHDGTEERKQSRSDLPFIAKQSKCKWHHQTSLNA